MKKWLISSMLKSKKFWYAVASIVVPVIVTYLGVDEETATKLFQAAIALIIGQGIADSGKK
jgi:lipoprotein signal peptidase|tara:strand:- start:11 stop:193 length:183 start_codon:yes stop_codon:yes gene_type:complete